MSKSIMVTGASKGIGLRTVREFFYADNDVTDFILLSRRSDEFTRGAQGAGGEQPVRQEGHAVLHRPRRPRRPRRDDEGRSWRSHGNVDILVNNAGFTAPMSIQQIDFADFERTIGVNLYAPFTIVQSLLHNGNTFELIVNIASTAGINGRSGWLTYSASKAAVISMSEVMKEELAIYGTRVVCISPGRCATDLRRTLAPDEDPTTIMQPEHVAAVIAMLASPVGRFVDSQNLVVRM